MLIVDGANYLVTLQPPFGVQNFYTRGHSDNMPLTLITIPVKTTPKMLAILYNSP